MIRIRRFFHSPGWAGPAIFLLLAAAIGLNLRGALPYFSSAVQPDSLSTYLPYAQALISHKLAFFLDERSLRVVPMAYIYPALFGADPGAIKIGNAVLSCLLVLVLYRLGSTLHSRVAGIAAAFLYALSPVLAEYKPAVLTEPLFIFLSALWLMSVAEIMAGRKSFIPLAGFACGLMILTRGSYIYFLYAVLLATLAMCCKKEWREIGQKLFAAHLLAVFFPLLVVVKNWLVFNFPGLATGVGSALYFGSHPLTEGYEAPYFALGYDIGAVTRELDHLSIAGDQLLKSVALFMLKQQSWPAILDVYVQKAFAFVFVSKAILPDTVWNLRSLRIVEVILGAVGLFALRPILMRWFIGAALAYQLIVHVPMLYTHRYSVGALEVPLIVLAAVGVAHVLRGQHPWQHTLRRLGAVCAALFIAVMAGEWHRTHSQALMPDILSVPHDELHVWDKQSLAAAATNGAVLDEKGAYRVTGTQWTIDIPIPRLSLMGRDEFYVFSIGMKVSPQRLTHGCGAAAIYFRTADEPGFTEGKSRYFRLRSDGVLHFYHVSATYGLSPLYPDQAGFLRIAGNCPQNSTIELDKIVLSLSRVAQIYRNGYLESSK